MIFLSSCRGIVQKCHTKNETGKQQQERQLLNDNEKASDSDASDHSRSESIDDEKDGAD